jgi:membrane protein YdbS with pleckstrin-like domain
MRRIIIKEGPLVFLRDVVVMEIFATLIFFGATFLANYEMLYESSFLAHLIRYEIFLIIIFSLFQLTYISVLFLHWYFSHFEITEKEIVRKSGLLFRHRKAVSLSDVATVELYQSPWGRWMHHGTIILEHNNHRITKIRNVSNYDEYIYVIKQMVYTASGRVLSRDPHELIQEGESRFLEFKETLRYDTRKGEVSKEMEKSVIKTIVGFLNADGGTLLIGVNDMGQVIGLENDYKTLPKKSRDGFENHLSLLIRTMIGLNFSKYINIKFERIDSKDICMVVVREGHKPAYLINGDKKEDFFVRVGNSTQPYTMSEASEYIKTHWG